MTVCATTTAAKREEEHVFAAEISYVLRTTQLWIFLLFSRRCTKSSRLFFYDSRKRHFSPFRPAITTDPSTVLQYRESAHDDDALFTGYRFFGVLPSPLANEMNTKDECRCCTCRQKWKANLIHLTICALLHQLLCFASSFPLPSV